MPTTVKRKPKTLRTFPTQARKNRQNSNAKAAATLAEMFPGKIIVYKLDYTPSHMPLNATRANDRLRYFRSKIRAAYKTSGYEPPKMFWNSQYTKADGWRHVIVIDDTAGADVNVEMLWCYGFAKRQAGTIDTVCRAVEATDRARGRRRWSHTRAVLPQ